MKVVNSLIERCFEVVELLAEDGGAMRLGDISEHLELPKSVTHRLLTSLVGIGWIEQEQETGFYSLTLRLAIVGQRHLIATKIPDVCQPVLDRLANQGRDLVRMAMVENERLTWVAFAQGARTGVIYHPEMIAKVPLHCTSGGKAFLATLPDEDAVRLALSDRDFGKPGRFGPKAPRTVEEVMRSLAETRERGWSTVFEEASEGVGAVAAAICLDDAGRTVVGTVSLAGPIFRFTQLHVEKMAGLVTAAARELGSLWPLRPRQTVQLPAAVSSRKR